MRYRIDLLVVVVSIFAMAADRGYAQQFSYSWQQVVSGGWPSHHWGFGAGYFSDYCPWDGYGWGGYGYDVTTYPPPANYVVMPPPVVPAPAGVADPIARIDAAAGRRGFVPGQRGNLEALAPMDDRHEEILRRVDALKRSTPAGRERADRLISAGDHAFGEQIYARATSRYRDAIARAPDYPEPHFRLAHAYVATRRYNLALTSALMALELAGSSRRDGFSLEEMYRGHKFSRRTHDERLLDAALREPQDGGLQFLIGLTYHYGGNPLKAREHFREAAVLPGPQRAYVRHFLPVDPVAEPAPRPEAPAVR